jgi:ABC-type multidrug transport system ATPase subunit
MIDGEIVTQGTVADLRTAGLLDGVASLAAAEKDRERHAEGSTSDSSEDGVTGDDEESSNSDEDTDKVAKKVQDIMEQVRAKDRERQGKTGRKLVQEEERQTGNVKWEIYDTYLKAS